ncbi:ABC transporter ATP-binding protein [Microbacterium saperdae]|uniref:Iron complex transport system ATP-binding protein n=1 Tax=Microbacterium saperdae TaxID=69368 RepID=A0A543BIF5_9MICO|nr:ABC transporter ATP-binding protein [Microbacterium saperdae]TQL84627.1 iron complex transport system ATP-binding protein [Microbacterium saperdae]GGM61804.1 cobalamin/Fe3+-siderophore ABC transporter ATP-binding protein [Microbacterium saperdae]
MTAVPPIAEDRSDGPHSDILRAEAIRVGYDTRVVIDGLDVGFPVGSITALVGPNASGKSTLLKALARLLPLQAGQVLLDGAALQTMSSRVIAQRLGVLPQSPLAPEGITVADLVSRGRHPHGRLLRRSGVDDLRVVADALVVTGTAELADRPVESLSGGQRQRVWIAMALAQQTSLLLLDEPTTYLDIAHQIEVLDLLADLRAAASKTIVMVLHDLEQAAAYADRLLVLSEGRLVAEGPPREVLTEQLVQDVFGLRSRIIPDPDTGTPLILPRGRHSSSPTPQEIP